MSLSHVLSKGDAEHIAKWTMAQTDAQVFDGIEGLSYRVVQARDNAAKADEAIEWFALVMNWLEDQPPDHVFPAIEFRRAQTTRELVRHAFAKAASDAYYNPSLDRLLQRLRPDDRHSTWLDDWERSVARLNESRHKAAEIAASKLPNLPPTRPASAPTTGTWTYVIVIETLEINATADLTQAGAILIGTVKAGEDKKGLVITDGKISGNDVNFTLDREMEQGTLRSTYAGKIEGDRIRGTIEIGWLNRDEAKTKVAWNAKRAKAK